MVHRYTRDEAQGDNDGECSACRKLRGGCVTSNNTKVACKDVLSSVDQKGKLAVGPIRACADGFSCGQSVFLRQKMEDMELI